MDEDVGIDLGVRTLQPCPMEPFVESRSTPFIRNWG
jgi:hypothetical protein